MLAQTEEEQGTMALMTDERGWGGNGYHKKKKKGFLKSKQEETMSTLVQLRLRFLIN